MKVVVLNSNSADKIIEHFVAYGYDRIISFGKADGKYYSLNGIKVTEIRGFPFETTQGMLLKIRGSLCESFMVVYSTLASNIDPECLERFHREHQCIATLAIVENRLCAAVFEPEIFDYTESTVSLERETLLKIAQDGEMKIFK